MMQKHSIKSLYPLALAEGEGVGTAYEYFAKRLHLIPWLQPAESITRVLIAGLPQKYGSSLDFLLLASEFEASVVLVDERSSALDKAKTALGEAQCSGCLNGLEPEFRLLGDLGSLQGLDGRFDLVLSSETLQRLTPSTRLEFIQRLLQLSPRVALFAPNDDNPAHLSQSGLAGIRLAELEKLVKQGILSAGSDGANISAHIAYIDMPPFPPGITRTEEQREQATSGRGEAMAMWGLGIYAQLEEYFPRQLHQSKAHIVSALIGSS